MKIQQAPTFQVFTYLLLSIPSSVMATDYIAPPMASIPAGDFIMGSNSGDPAFKPAHKVSIKAFQMAKYPVTVAEFRKFVEDSGYTPKANCNDYIGKNWLSGPDSIGTARWDNHRFYQSEYQPVSCVTYRDAVAYITWLNQKTGGTYRLPTLQEFEYAAKANTTSRFFWGDDLNMTQACLYGNFADESGEYIASKQYGASYVGFLGYANCDDGEAYIAIAGLYRPNPFGLYDMSGNTSEITASCFSHGYQTRSKEDNDIEKCEYIAHKGPSWHYPPQSHAYGWRVAKKDDSPGASMSFRLAADDKLAHTDGSTTQFEADMAKAQSAHLAKRDRLPKRPVGLQLSRMNADTYELSWHSAIDPTVTEYDIYQSKSRYSHLLGGFYQDHYNKLKTVAATKNTTTLVLPKSGASFRVVAKSANLTSLPSVAAANYTPKVVNIPGRLNMQEAIKLENALLGHRAATPEKPELYYLSAFSHGLVQPKVTATFDVKIQKTGWYSVNYRAQVRQKGKFIRLWQGNKLAGEISYDPEIDETTASHQKVFLEAGYHHLEVSVKREGFESWYLAWIDFIEIK
ncbi:SUMF1/EgtB/PvdO family nonheme iron enzyme [Pseudoalteromonas luteoviolacea]|uniref:Sulfatase-modifying factor enzyme-like domain-containing protein n=1 Tax=Pseudoalteromonas luteoviolacea (strain 2ta16) TaxID=1353533 RepID=V4HKT4_PSEL2|nr:SUMF1/EgtB/PvdO family nonheme iron enzyme [Pseudoalteromonas luteoviolacea]ESP91425.1 hypothetical protein PL2TA16_00224 [Pseudoalteromonas luteoviolacea 2ta16]KZN40073.1 hypothetical protein N483_17960 [Pseudoalteromonas luteoviolacea NCIMB 1944]